MGGRKPNPHGPARVHQVTLPASLAARIAAWGEAQGVPRVKGKPNLSGALARWAESLPVPEQAIAEAMTEGCPPEVPQNCPRICWDCDRQYVGTIRCPYPGCDGVGEPLESTGE